MRINLLILFFALMGFQLKAQAPESFKYQATIRDAAHAILANKQVSIRLNIIQGSMNGTVSYSESFLTQTNAVGLVNLEIGNGNVLLGSISSIDWSDGPFFIETAIDLNAGNNYVSLGISQLLSVPFALYAKTSGSSIPGPIGPQGIQGPAGSNGLSAYEIALANGFIGTETEWLASLEGATGQQGNQGPEGLLSSGSSAGNTPFWDGSKWVVNSSNIFNSGGNIGIGTTSPNASSKLDVSSNSQGFLPPRMSITQRDAIANPADGLMIFNTSSGCPNYYYNGSWHEWCGTSVSPKATLTALHCDSMSTLGNLIMSIPTINSSITIPYVGGNGGTYATQVFNSSGVNGLMAELNGSQFNIGSGNLHFVVSGTPDNSGAATFQITVGGKTCSLSLSVGLPSPTIVSSSPISPNNSSTSPTLVLSGPANKTIEIFNNATGSGSPIAATTTDNSGNATISVNVNANTTSTLTAIASDGQGNVSPVSAVFSYTHDNLAPAAPVITSSSPTSPSNSSVNPLLNGTASAGSVLKIYNNATGTGSPIATVVVGASGLWSTGVTVNANTTTNFTATQTDAAGNVSPVSAVFSYTHDNVAPAAPVITSSSPTSPSNSTVNPILNGTASAGSVLKIYNNATGTGSPVTSLVVGASGTWSAIVSVMANTTTTFTATQTDAAGNVSPVSAAFNYTHTP